jgi:hypothetical protein
MDYHSKLVLVTARGIPRALTNGRAFFGWGGHLCVVHEGPVIF